MSYFEILKLKHFFEDTEVTWSESVYYDSRRCAIFLLDTLYMHVSFNEHVFSKRKNRDGDENIFFMGYKIFLWNIPTRAVLFNCFRVIYGKYKRRQY